MNQNPSLNADMILTGETAQDGFGSSVSGIGDVNNDNYDDLAIGACNASYSAYQAVYEMRKEEGHPNPFRFFKELAVDIGSLAFRAFPDGTIGAGVYGEIMAVKQAGGLVIELPSMLECRGLSVDQTRAYLKELGAR